MMYEKVYYLYEERAYAFSEHPSPLYANEQQAYTLMDRATWLTLRKDLNLDVLVENDPIMLNLIALIRVNPARFPAIRKDAALKFADWLVGNEAQTIIRDFGVDKYGSPLFFPNSEQWKARHGKWGGATGKPGSD